MTRRALLLLVFAGASLGAPSLKKLLDPLNPDFPLQPYSWEAWDELDKDARFKAKGADISKWLEPPPKTEEEIAAEKKKAEERQKKLDKLTEFERQQLKDNQEKAKKRRRELTIPGFQFGSRQKSKREAFEELIQPASASKLEGLIKQLKLLDRVWRRFEKRLDETEEEYVKYRTQLDKIMLVQYENNKKQGKKNPEQVLVPTVLQNTVAKHAKQLQRLLSLRQSEEQFQAWVVDRLAQLVLELTPEERKKPVTALARGVADKDWRYRIRCARLLGRLGDEQSVAAFVAAMDKERDPLVLAELIRIRVKRGGEGVIELLAKKLDDEEWPVRAAAVRALAGMRKRQSVELLVVRLQKEDGRLLDDITDALKALTGKDFEPKPDPWRIWWDKVGKTWTPPPEVKAGQTVIGKKDDKTVYFYGIRSSSKRVVFCIDISGSMEFPLDGKDGKKPKRIVRAKKELIQALSALPDDALFNIVVYNVTVKVWKRRMQTATLKVKQSARKFVERLEPTGGTNIFDALLMSLEVAATAGKKVVADTEADTIFFLTDGQPTAGRITDPKQIIEEITTRNRLLGLKIHTVGVSREQNAGFLLNLAKRNNGQYVGHK